MRANRILKPQDIVVLGKLVTDKWWPTQKEIATTLDLSQSEISHSLRTLEQVGLINLPKKRTNNLAIFECVVHAIKFFYPIEKQGVGRGKAVGPSYSYFKQKIEPGDFNYVWPDPEGDSKGVIVIPLFSNLTELIKRNEKLLLFLNAVEVLRGLGGVRHQQEAQKLLKEILG